MKAVSFILTGGIFILSFVFVSAQSISLSTFATGLSNTVDIKNVGDQRLFVVQKTGRIRIIDSSGTIYPTSFLDIQSRVGSASSERGLLGLAFHPDYKTNGYFFVNYTNLAGHTRISRFNVTANPDIADPASEIILLTIYQPFSNHNGGYVEFGPEGYLYIGMGDGGSGGDPAARSQNKDSLLGKILRIDVNNPNPPYYSSPPTNPFYGATAGRDEIWATGVRNPWRASFDRITGDFWMADVGQGAQEEINFQPANTTVGGINYGWRCYEGTATYNTSGCGPAANYKLPIATYTHAGGNCSVTGGYIYRGGKWGDLSGYYFYEDYCSGVMRSIKSNGAGGWTVNNSVGTYLTGHSTFGEDRYGELYVARLSGTIYKIKGTTCKPTAVITYKNTIPTTANFCKGTPITLKAIFGDSLTYQWKINGNNIPGATLPSYAADSAGNYSVLVTNYSACTNTSAAVVLVDTCTGAALSASASDPTVCAGACATITASPGGGTSPYTFSWSPGNQTLQAITVCPSANSVYTVTVTDAVGATVSATSVVTVTSLPVANAGPNFTVTTGQSATLTGSGGGTYSWSTTPVQITASIVVTPTATTTYTLTVTVNGCSSTDVVTVTFIPTGVNEFTVSGLQFSIFPNPSNGVFQIQVAEVSSSTHPYTIQILNVLGERVFQATTSRKQETLSLDVPEGIYFLQVKTSEGSGNKTIIISK